MCTTPPPDFIKKIALGSQQNQAEGSFPIYLFPSQHALLPPLPTPHPTVSATTGEPVTDTSLKLIAYSGAHSRRSASYRFKCVTVDYCIMQISKSMARNILCLLFQYQTKQFVAYNAHIRTELDFWRVCVPAQDHGGWLICEAGGWPGFGGCWCFGFLGLYVCSPSQMVDLGGLRQS